MTTKTKNAQNGAGEEVLDLGPLDAQQANQAPDVAAMAEPWLHERMNELARLVGNQSYQLNEKRRELKGLYDAMDRMGKQAAALEAEIEQREQAMETNQTALDFCSMSIQRIQGEQNGKA